MIANEAIVPHNIEPRTTLITTCRVLDITAKLQGLYHPVILGATS